MQYYAHVHACMCALYTCQVHSEDSNKWRDVSNTIENVNVSLPFRLVDAKGNQVRARLMITTEKCSDN